MNYQIKNEKVNKSLSHAVLLILDFFCIWGVWVGYNDLIELLIELGNKVDTISFGSRDGFYILGFGLPLLHLLVIIEHFWSNIRKYKRIVNSAVIILVIILFGIGIIGSSWIKSKVENAGYVYCRNASGISALARTLVYTKNIKICEELVEINSRNR